jgi:hypothetical protein
MMRQRLRDRCPLEQRRAVLYIQDSMTLALRRRVPHICR